jgi:hypothetical protein
MTKITKDMTKPAPGDYKTEDAFEKTQATNIKYRHHASSLASLKNTRRERATFLR